VRARYGLAAGFVVAVAALIAVRAAGYLGGRAQGGPLTVALTDVGARPAASQIFAAGFADALDGDPVRVQNVRAREVSPGLDVLGPNASAAGCGRCLPRRWPPPGAGAPLEAARLSAPGGRAVVGLRARRRGFYSASELVIDYRRGQRRFRRRTPGGACIAVRVRASCDPSPDPGDARVAEIGGPSRYAGARFGPGRPQATFTGAGEHRLRMTLSNRTRSTISVSALGLDPTPGVALLSSDPASLRLPPHGARSVRLRFAGCAEPTFDRLRADLDGERRTIALSVPLAFRCP